MNKIHYTTEYTFYDDKYAVTLCGLYAKASSSINVTILKNRVNCKKCLQILNKLNT
jgi:hypothetical protein